MTLCRLRAVEGRCLAGPGQGVGNSFPWGLGPERTGTEKVDEECCRALFCGV